jgi:hypothetical protein
MTASKIDGTAIAKSIRERLGGYIKEKQEVNPRYRPSLKIVQGRMTRLVCLHAQPLTTDRLQWATDLTPAPMCA